MSRIINEPLSPPRPRDHLSLAMALTVGGFVILILLFYFLSGCAESIYEINERMARQEYAKDRADCRELRSYPDCMRAKGWRR